MVECADGSLYTGWTVDLERRLQMHNQGRGAKYTRARLPVKLVASWEMASRSQAMQFERSIKKLRRQDKERLISEA
jgi:putative endonuclease